jgi:hypothetical protein
MLNRVEVAALMSEAAGRTIEAGEVSFDEWADAAKIAPGPVRTGLKRMYSDYDQCGFPGGNALVLRKVLGREPRSLRQFFEELARREQKAA